MAFGAPILVIIGCKLSLLFFGWICGVLKSEEAEGADYIGLSKNALSKLGLWSFRVLLYAFASTAIASLSIIATIKTHEWLSLPVDSSYAFYLILIAIATEPENAFNANYLHKMLMGMTMPERDNLWSAIIAKHGETQNSSVETLISWTLENDKEPIDQEQAKLCCITLIWLFSTTNRVIRDRATKALVSILSPRLEISLELILSFKDIDDEYVLERVLASIYGAALRGAATDDILSQICNCIYTSFFENGTPPVNILLRDHARGIIEYAKHRGCLTPNISIEKCRPPYKSHWPIEHVSDDIIESYKENFNGRLFSDSIVSSCVHDGDFARYIVDYEVRKWSPALRGDNPPSDEDIYNNWHREFEKNASKRVLKAYDRLLKAKDATSGQGPYAETPEMKAYKKAQNDFRDVIGNDAWEDYRVRGQTGRRTGQFHSLSGKASFDHGWARRWVCKRAHDLGWSDELHGKFDKSDGVSRDRMGHHTERIGKKYQWLALFELIARMSDNLAYIPDEHDDDPEIYDGAWQTGLRDIDPSLSMVKTEVSIWDEFKKPSWWMPYVPNLAPMEPLERLHWRDSKDDIVCNTSLIDLKDASGEEWLNLSVSCLWRQNRSEKGEENIEKKVHLSVNCIVVEKKNFHQALSSLMDTSLYDTSFFPSIRFSSGSGYIGEYCWHPAFSHFQNDICTKQYKIPVPIGATTASYLCEKGGYDYSIEESVNVNLPAPWLIRSADLKPKNEKQFTYINDAGDLQFFDPSVLAEGYRASLVKKETFLRALKKESLEAFWIVNVSKEIFGGKQMRLDFGGRFDLTGVFYIEENEFKGHLYENLDRPYKSQLRSMLGEEPPENSPVREEAQLSNDTETQDASELAYKNLLQALSSSGK